jgi:FG-GAP-like repeat/Domain of unknown function (DUF4214)
MSNKSTSSPKRLPAVNRSRLTLWRFLVLILAISAVQRVGAQGVKFTTPVTYPAGHPYVITAGDFNRDGKMDLVGGDVTNNDVVMLMGNGDGTLKPRATYHLAAAPYEIVPADFNRDGKLDLAIADSSPSKSSSIFFGKGDGSFEPPVTYAVAGRHLVAADFNGDGWPDLAALTGILPNGGVAVMLNNGHGSFQKATSYAFSQAPLVMAAVDVNRDGRVDLVGVSRTGTYPAIRTVSVLVGNGNGTFQPPIDSSGNLQGSGPFSINIRDFDRDGKVDVVFADDLLNVFKGNGDGTFKAPSAQPNMHGISADLKLADFNGDGSLDLVSTAVLGGGIRVLLGKGDGTFEEAAVFESALSGTSVVAVDLNGDTRPDIVGNPGGQLTVALLNVTPGNVDNPDYFVHQHYMDFLDREPDALGFNFWTNQISSCESDQQCVEVKRNNVSASFYLSIEFQQTAFLIERMYKTAYGDAIATSTFGGAHQRAVPMVRLNDLLMDSEEIGQGVVVGQSGWETVLELNKQNLFAQSVQRPAFVAAFPTTLTPAQFVDKLNQNAESVLSAGERATAIALFGGALDTSNIVARAQALRQVAESQNLYNAEFNRAFVLMEYFGYLRRNPNDTPDSDYSGYDFWLSKLNQFNGDFIKAEMVKAFITSAEYRKRFDQP